MRIYLQAVIKNIQIKVFFFKKNSTVRGNGEKGHKYSALGLSEMHPPGGSQRMQFVSQHARENETLERPEFQQLDPSHSRSITFSLLPLPKAGKLNTERGGCPPPRLASFLFNWMVGDWQQMLLRCWVPSYAKQLSSKLGRRGTSKLDKSLVTHTGLPGLCTTALKPLSCFL